MHCVVTSPPYYSLRDYRVPPSVWGGDAACDHEWGEWREAHDEREATLAGKSRTTDRCYGAPSRRHAVSTATTRSTRPAPFAASAAPGSAASGSSPRRISTSSTWSRCSGRSAGFSATTAPRGSTSVIPTPGPGAITGHGWASSGPAPPNGTGGGPTKTMAAGTACRPPPPRRGLSPRKWDGRLPLPDVRGTAGRGGPSRADGIKVPRGKSKLFAGKPEGPR